MSAPRSTLGLTGESPVWVKASHQPSTNSHVWGGNKLCEAGRREVSGRNASECIEPRNYPCVGGRCCSYSSRQHACNRKMSEIKHPNVDPQRRGYKSPTGSEAVARYQKELMQTWESQGISKGGYAVDKPINGKQQQMISWQSDYFIVLVKQGNACGEKGVAGTLWTAGTHLPHTEVERR